MLAPCYIEQESITTARHQINKSSVEEIEKALNNTLNEVKNTNKDVYESLIKNSSLSSIFEGGSNSKTRLLDEVVDKEFLEKMKATKNKISSKIKSKVNFGYANVSIEGIEKTEFYAHSAVDDLTEFKNRYNVSEEVIERMLDISILPDKQIFNTLEVNRKNIIGGEGAWDRIVDSEAKILHEIAEKLGENFKASGKIKLFTDYDCCPSCKYVIEQFKERYPQIEVEVVYRKKK